MLAIASLLVVVLISLIVTRVATVALVSTGLSREMARFQARSAFTGTGFTTQEAESVVNHPVRRRIVMALMLAGNAGLAKIGSIVHALEMRGDPVPEAAGVQTLLQGAVRRAASEDELLRETEKTFDLLYDAYCEPTAR